MQDTKQRKLGRDEILGTARTPIPFHVDDWDGTVYLLPLTLGDRIRLEELVTEGLAARFRTFLLCRSLVDENGSQLFDSEQELESIGHVGADVVLERILEINRIDLSGEEQEGN